ncbi:MAG: hypothetical protein MK089_03395 [Phycisphaerales bacterium]|nr:hypothetical protein [Phycisphaerales bacterium]
MMNVLFGSLTIFWLLIGSATAQVAGDQKPSMAAKITDLLADGTSVEAITNLIDTCGQPQIVIIPPRPGEPLQETVVSRVGDSLASLGINSLDGERVNAEQEREADLAYSQSNDAAAATRILLARAGDYELNWSMDVAMEGPMEIYGVETWEAKVDLHATLVDLVTGEDIESITATQAARQQTRERALDQAIETVIDVLAQEAALPILSRWYGMASGDGFVQVRISASSAVVDQIQQQLAGVEGVQSVMRSLPTEPPRLMVHGSLNAQELSIRIGQGEPISCRELLIVSGTRSSWILWAGIGSLVILVIASRIVSRNRRPSAAL